MTRSIVLIAGLTLAGCATAVVHPTKSDAEMRADVSACTTQANAKHEWEPFAALDEAYACLGRLGYRPQRDAYRGAVEREVRQDRAERRQSPLPCAVPCRPTRP